MLWGTTKHIGPRAYNLTLIFVLFISIIQFSRSAISISVPWYTKEQNNNNNNNNHNNNTAIVSRNW